MVYVAVSLAALFTALLTLFSGFGLGTLLLPVFALFFPLEIAVAATAWGFSAMGFLSLLWFLVRVIPKPSRAAYPCQRAAFPLASSFIVWVTALLGSAFAWRKFRRWDVRFWEACLWGAAALELGAFVVASLPTVRA